MKKISVILLFLFSFSLCGCAANQEAYEDAYIYNKGAIEYFWDSEEKWSKHAELLREYDEFQAYMEPLLSGKTPDGLSEKLTSYDEEWFADKMLAVIHHYEGSATPEISVKGVGYEGTVVRVTLARDRKEDIAVCMAASYFILAELPRDASYTSVEYRVEDWNSEAWKDTVQTVGGWILNVTVAAGVVFLLVRAVRRKKEE